VAAQPAGPRGLRQHGSLGTRAAIRRRRRLRRDGSRPLVGQELAAPLAIALITINLIGDTANVVVGTEPRALIGMPIAILLLLFLATRRARIFFGS